MKYAILLLCLLGCEQGSVDKTVLVPGLDRIAEASTGGYTITVLRLKTDEATCFVVLGYNKGGISCVPKEAK